MEGCFRIHAGKAADIDNRKQKVAQLFKDVLFIPGGYGLLKLGKFFPELVHCAVYVGQSKPTFLALFCIFSDRQRAGRLLATSSIAEAVVF